MCSKHYHRILQADKLVRIETGAAIRLVDVGSLSQMNSFWSGSVLLVTDSRLDGNWDLSDFHGLLIRFLWDTLELA